MWDLGLQESEDDITDSGRDLMIWPNLSLDILLSSTVPKYNCTMY